MNEIEIENQIVENLDKHKESLYRKGFGTTLNEALEKAEREGIKEGKPEFFLEHFATIKDDEMGYRLHFRKDNEKPLYYFNSIDAALLKNSDAPGEVREHNFPTEKLITATEMHRMLKYGELVAVNKTLFNKEGEQYNAWLSLDLTSPKDEYGNYQVNSYHENYYKKYPFDLKAQLANPPVLVKELEKAGFRDNIEKSLKKANLVTVTIFHKGEETTGTLGVNPKVGTLVVYDKDMRVIEKESQRQKVEPAEKIATPEQKQEEVKKKPWPNQKVSWEKKSQPKGMSR